MDSMRSLTGSLPAPQGPVSCSANENLLGSFKEAALQVTNLYRSAVGASALSRQEGYRTAIDELVEFLECNGMVNDPSSDGYRVHQWAAERLLQMSESHQSGGDDDVRTRSPPRDSRPGGHGAQTGASHPMTTAPTAPAAMTSASVTSTAPAAATMATSLAAHSQPGSAHQHPSGQGGSVAGGTSQSAAASPSLGQHQPVGTGSLFGRSPMMFSSFESGPPPAIPAGTNTAPPTSGGSTSEAGSLASPSSHFSFPAGDFTFSRPFVYANTDGFSGATPRTDSTLFARPGPDNFGRFSRPASRSMATPWQPSRSSPPTSPPSLNPGPKRKAPDSIDAAIAAGFGGKRLRH